MLTRILSAVVLMAVVGAVLFLAPWWAGVVLATLVAALAAWEMAGLSAAAGIPTSTPVLVTAAVAVCVATALTPDVTTGGPLTPVLLALVVGAGLVALSTSTPSPAALTRAGWLVMAPLYVGVPLGVLGWIQMAYGPLTLVFLLAVVAISDSAQYASGRAFGRHKLAPTISPGKTREGAVGGVVVAVIAAALLGPLWINGLTMGTAAAIGVLITSLGIAGDLFESLLKRSAGVKDSSDLIPGHGGVLDRIDAHLFAAPAFALCLGYLL